MSIVEEMSDDLLSASIDEIIQILKEHDNPFIHASMDPHFEELIIEGIRRGLLVI